MSHHCDTCGTNLLQVKALLVPPPYVLPDVVEVCEPCFNEINEKHQLRPRGYTRWQRANVMVQIANMIGGKYEAGRDPREIGQVGP